MDEAVALLPEETHGVIEALEKRQLAKHGSALLETVSDSGAAQLSSVFNMLVKEDGDVIGLVAYALYKQSKRDWMISFTQEHGRQPNEAELQAFIVGERTDRRLATYRRLAEDILEYFRRDGAPVKALVTRGSEPVRPEQDETMSRMQRVAHLQASPPVETKSFFERLKTRAMIAAGGLGVLLLLYLILSRMFGR